MFYHYTSLLHLPFILLDGQLKPSRRQAHGPHSQGLLWFSVNRERERSVGHEGVPLVRFASEDGQIETWRKAAKSVGFSQATMRRLELSGRKMGSAPTEWRAKVGGCSLEATLSLEIYFSAWGWQPVERSVLCVESQRDGSLLLVGPGGTVVHVIRGRAVDGMHAYAANRESMNGLATLEPTRLERTG